MVLVNLAETRALTGNSLAELCEQANL